ncbi:unnamed protein product [Phytomonas sp. Hart1]|nr:unnamed protein product [Phytomonas sp. Hart1]|eukprot:CCW71266.1 unnamed protein product [Phytomonas sp. isolate Hart1]
MQYVELEDVGGRLSAGSHWKMRNAKDELMSPINGSNFYTAITIAAMEDTGCYKGNYSNAENMVWGKNAGCVLFDKKCVIDGVPQVPEMFCVVNTTYKSEFMCASDRMGIGRCLIIKKLVCQHISSTSPIQKSLVLRIRWITAHSYYHFLTLCA